MKAVARADALNGLARGNADRRDAGLHRTLVARPPADGLIDLAGNDYLGLTRHPVVVEAGVAAVRAYGAGSTGSRLVTGTTELHEALEGALTDLVGLPSALVYSSGYLANIGAVTSLAGPRSLVVSDERNHASLIDACRLSRARVVVTPHADTEAVERALAEREEEQAVVVTDALFSVDGDLAPLTEIYAVARRHGAVLLVDEAHSLGVVGSRGQGAAAAAGLLDETDVVVTVTLSKALGSQGGAVLGSTALRDHMIDTARTFIFDTALAPAAAGAALAALALVDADRVARLHHVAAVLARSLGQPPPPGALLSLGLGAPQRAAAARDACLAHGVRVGCFRPPSVPPGASCLRIAARADLSDAEVQRAAEVVRSAVR